MSLFKPAWQSKNHKRAVEAVKRLTDQKLLVEIAKGQGINRDLYPSQQRDVALAAVEILTDQSLLADVAKYGRNGGLNFNDRKLVAHAAVDKLTDIQLLAKVADWDPGYAKEAAALKLESLTIDQDPVAIAKTSGFSDKRLKAVKTLTEQSDLSDVAEHAPAPEVRLAAADRLVDTALAQQVFLAVATSGGDTKVCWRAAQKLTDPGDQMKAYTEIVKHFHPGTGRYLDYNADVSKVTHTMNGFYISIFHQLLSSQNALTDVALNARDGHTRKQAAMCLSDKQLAIKALEQCWSYDLMGPGEDVIRYNASVQYCLDTCEKEK